MSDDWEVRGFHLGSDKETVFYTSAQETAAIEEYCAALRAENRVTQSKDKAFRLAAILPTQMVEQIRIRHISPERPFGINIMDGSPDAKILMRRLLQSGDVAKFMVSPL